MCPSDLNKECTECCPVLTQAQNFTLESSWNWVRNLCFLHFSDGTTHRCPADSLRFPPMKHAQQKCRVRQCYTWPHCSLSLFPCCSLRQVPLRHLFGWKNGARHRNRAATELAGHISGLDSWELEELPPHSVQFKLARHCVPALRERPRRQVCPVIYLKIGKKSHHLRLVLASLITTLFTVKMTRLILLVEDHCHITVCGCLSTCSD